MESQEIRDLIKVFQESGLKSMELEIPGVRLHLEAATGNALPPEIKTEEALPEPAEELLATFSDQVEKVVREKKEEQDEPELPLVELRAPLVGTFYRSQEAQMKPFTDVGEHVQKGDTVCIIDAMKMMNYIEAPCDGTVVSIVAENEKMVEYDQLLMEFREDV